MKFDVENILDAFSGVFQANNEQLDEYRDDVAKSSFEPVSNGFRKDKQSMRADTKVIYGDYKKAVKIALENG
jgi:hypothetical protein